MFSVSVTETNHCPTKLIIFMLHLLYILQALEMQGNRSEALLELSKICNVFQVFPPEESSVCVLIHF